MSGLTDLTDLAEDSPKAQSAIDGELAKSGRQDTFYVPLSKGILCAQRVVMFWRTYRCACGEEYQSPAYGHSCFWEYVHDKGTELTPLRGYAPQSRPKAVVYDHLDIFECPRCCRTRNNYEGQLDLFEESIPLLIPVKKPKAEAKPKAKPKIVDLSDLLE